MLEHLRKFFATQKEEVNMSKEVYQDGMPDLSSADNELVLAPPDTSLSDALAAAKELNASQANTLAELTAKLEQAQAVLTAIEADKASLVAQAATAKLEARKAQVVAAIGTDKATAMLEATSSLGDEQFAAVVGALATSLEVEAQSAMFQEVGATGEVDASKIDEQPTHFKQFIKTK